MKRMKGMNNKPRASIIIPSRGMVEGLRKLFRALALEVAGQKVEVILVDDGSRHPLSFLEAEYRGKLNLKVVRQEPRGPAAARNLGVKNASAETIIFLDSDVTPLPGWFSALLSRLEQDPGLAGVEGKTISRNLEDLNPFSHYLENLEGGKYLTCNIAYRREWVEKVGGFDERFKHPWREDSDLAFSILEQGGKIIFAPEVAVGHPVRPVNLWRLFWFYPIRRGYEWLVFRRHPDHCHTLEMGFADLSEETFLFSFLLALIFFALGWMIPGFLALIFHQAIYNHILLRKLSFGTRVALNPAVPWKIYARAYPFFYPTVFLGLAGLLWGRIRFAGVKPGSTSGEAGK